MNASFVIGRAALALLLMAGFYLLALSMAFVLLWVPYAEVVYAEHITPKLAIVCIIGALTIRGPCCRDRTGFTRLARC